VVIVVSVYVIVDSVQKLLDTPLYISQFWHIAYYYWIFGRT